MRDGAALTALLPFGGDAFILGLCAACVAHCSSGRAFLVSLKLTGEQCCTHFYPLAPHTHTLPATMLYVLLYVLCRGTMSLLVPSVSVYVNINFTSTRAASVGLGARAAVINVRTAPTVRPTHFLRFRCLLENRFSSFHFYIPRKSIFF